MVPRLQEAAEICKALSDPNRLRIVEMLLSGEKCACELLEELNIAQSTLSHHMKLLCASSVVTGRPNGKWTFYSINKQGCDPVFRLVKGIMEAPNTNNASCDCD